MACGTTSGFVFVYDIAQNSPKSVFSVKGHDGIIFAIIKVISRIFSGFLSPRICSYHHRMKMKSTFGTEDRSKIHQRKFNTLNL